MTNEERAASSATLDPSPAREREGPAASSRWEGEGEGHKSPPVETVPLDPSPVREREGPAASSRWEGEGDHPHNLERQTGRARRLRREATPAERKLWASLRNRRLAGHRFQRQVPISPFFADFACAAARLIIEVDGAQHVTESDKDQSRTRHLAERGYRVIRFWNAEILTNIEAVERQILAALTLPLPSGGGPLPLPHGRGAESIDQ